MYYHRLIVSYKGTHYFGWQDLGLGDVKPTIEASIHQVLSKICKYQSCSISTASRTDAGVHAQGQVIKVSIPLAISSEKLLLGMNSLLAEDIRILHCDSCSQDFNPNRDSTHKEYHYYFSISKIHNPVLNDIVTHIPRQQGVDSLDIQAMQEGCKLFIGTHDFYSFAKRDTAMTSSFRRVVSCEIVQAPSLLSNDVYCLKIVGEGFLRYMVRYIVGAMFALGKKELSLHEISDALLHHKEEKLSARAKSRGLHLIEIYY